MAPRFLQSLAPRREMRQDGRPIMSVLANLTWIQWAMYFSGWLAWTCDAIDFFSVTLSVKQLGTTFKKPTHDITTAITLTLLFRSVGAVIFGIISDRFGRKWPLVANLVLVAVLELAAGFVNTFKEFLALRSLFGIGMGGIWGLATSTALENLPVEARGFASGVLQQGYAVGYLIAAVINLTLVHDTGTWRSLFWTAAGISMFAAAVRALLPESALFLKAKAIEKAKGTDTTKKTKVFIRETKEMLKRHWLLCIYAVLLMTGFNFLSHGSQDLYPTYLQEAKGFNPHDASIATIIGNCGAVSGGAIAGFVSQYIGRRLTIVLCVVWLAAFIPLWILPNSFGALSAGAFFLQSGVQGAWGVIPIQLAEMSPPAFRATFPGVAYQIGNMISSASAQIVATGSDNLRTTVIKNGKPENVPDYATVQGIFIGVVAAFVIIITVIGPENHGSHFERHRPAFEEGAADDDAVLEEEVLEKRGSIEKNEGGSVDEKKEELRNETV